MHTFKLTCPFALVLAIVPLAIAAPTSAVHTDPGSDAVVHAVGNVLPDSAVIEDTIVTHSLPTDKIGGSTLKREVSSPCSPLHQEKREMEIVGNNMIFP